MEEIWNGGPETADNIQHLTLQLLVFYFSFKNLDFYLNLTSARTALSSTTYIPFLLFLFLFSHLNKDWR